MNNHCFSRNNPFLHELYEFCENKLYCIAIQQDRCVTWVKTKNRESHEHNQTIKLNEQYNSYACDLLTFSIPFSPDLQREMFLNVFYMENVNSRLHCL